MCAHGQIDKDCPLCNPPPNFSSNQIAFLEDLLINKGCMQALSNGRKSMEPEKCRECACRLADMVELIRGMTK